MSELRPLSVDELIVQLEALHNQILNVGLQMEFAGGFGNSHLAGLFVNGGRELQRTSYIIRRWPEFIRDEKAKIEAQQKVLH